MPKRDLASGASKLVKAETASKLCLFTVSYALPQIGVFLIARLVHHNVTVMLSLQTTLASSFWKE